MTSHCLSQLLARQLFPIIATHPLHPTRHTPYLFRRLCQVGLEFLIVVARLLPLVEQVVVPVAELVLLRLKRCQTLLQLGGLAANGTVSHAGTGRTLATLTGTSR